MWPSVCIRFSVATLHQELAVAAEIARAEGAAAVEIGHVAEHLAPLAGKQVDDVDALRRALEQRGLRAEEVDVRIGRDPAALPPGQPPFELERHLAGPWRYVDLGADGSNLVAAA